MGSAYVYLEASMGQRHTWFWWALAAVVALWLLWMTLRPNETVATDLSPLTTSASERGISTHLLIDLAGNIVVFVPLGTALALALRGRPAGRRLLLATLGGAGLSLTIELIQTAIPTRVTALDDWLLNTAGTWLGALGGYWINKGFDRYNRPMANDE
jgi:glycopeptide antibiotics resistance protein